MIPPFDERWQQINRPLRSPPGPWWFKVARALEQLEQLDAQVRKYSDRRPYEVRRVRHGKSHLRRWKYRFTITEQPDRALAVMMGDVIHNVRSALDYIAVAISPRKRRRNARFPILDRDLWAPGTTGKHCRKARADFERTTRGMNEEAIAIVKGVQPYTSWSDDPLRIYADWRGERIGGDHPETHLLFILNQLNNLDKHCDLIAIATGLLERSVIKTGELVWPGRGVVLESSERTVDGALMDGETVEHFTVDPPPPEPQPEVQVEVSGTVEVTVKIGRPLGHTSVIGILEMLAYRVPFIVLPALERFL